MSVTTFDVEIQDGTQGDSLTITMYDKTGKLLSMSNVFSAQIQLQDPTGYTHPNLVNATFNASLSTVTLLTTTTLFTIIGEWTLRVYLNTSGGGTSKSQPIKLMVASI